MTDRPTEGAEAYAGIPRECIAWYPTIDPRLCQPDRCQLNCISWCPQHVYARGEGGRVTVARPLACTVGDVSCSFQCPFEAISFPNKRDLRRMLAEARRGL